MKTTKISCLLPIILVIFFLTPSLVCTKSTEDVSIGFFTVEKCNEDWMFITPEGEAFFSVGIGSISATAGYSPALGYSQYHRNMLEK